MYVYISIQHSMYLSVSPKLPFPWQLNEQNNIVLPLRKLAHPNSKALLKISIMFLSNISIHIDGRKRDVNFPLIVAISVNLGKSISTYITYYIEKFYLLYRLNIDEKIDYRTFYMIIFRWFLRWVNKVCKFW